MRKLRMGILFILLFFSLCFLSYGIYTQKRNASREAMETGITDLSSTKDWFDMTSSFLSRRNELIGDVLNGKYIGSRRYISVLRQMECSPLLDGDILLLDYMSRKRNKFKDRFIASKIEYLGIKKLTKDEVTLEVRLGQAGNESGASYNYEIVFSNVDGKWLVSKYSVPE